MGFCIITLFCESLLGEGVRKMRENGAEGYFDVLLTAVLSLFLMDTTWSLGLPNAVIDAIKSRLRYTCLIR